jgi:hypothetical protein
MLGNINEYYATLRAPAQCCSSLAGLRVKWLGGDAAGR